MMLRQLDGLRMRLGKLPWIGLLLSILFLQGVFALPSYKAPEYQRQQSHTYDKVRNGLRVSETNKVAGSISDDNRQDAQHLGWLVTYHDELIAIGTLILGFFAALQWRDSKISSERQLRAYVVMESGTIYDLSLIGVKAKAPDLFNPSLLGFAKIVISIKNSGQTPAKKVVHLAHIVVSDPHAKET